MPTPHVETVKVDELDCWRIRHNGAELMVARQGAHIFSYQRQGEQPLIWPNPEAVFQPGKGIRTGVPVCWPWFGVFDRNPQSVKAMRKSEQPAGAHGFVRTALWELAETAIEGEALRIELVLPVPAGGFPDWPHQVNLKLSLLLDDRLHIQLTSHNLGTGTVTLSQALHTYFAVSDVRNVQVEGLDGLAYIDTADGWTEKQQAGQLQFTAETDRIYLDTPAQLSIVDQDWQRRVQLTSQGSNSTVVWNPWTERAKALDDMADDGWQGMLCIETANVLDDVVSLAPGESHTLGVSITSITL
ncbi:MULTISPECIES: D-hexose-6-phosphate mutarotase [Pseudomonas]|uniref:Putative glucose-6-phosphate 1-epimerase n=2 Tax=Pseudomonas TaxID=286 RepID=A0A0D0SKC1_PSEFL|nr:MULTISPECIES: D-hexose-6-phosphate mutarotase [Pseudomonas fluorescens group]AZE64153.1 Aldose 1-epimerase family protein YeaD [Pseudomonas synxantha]KIR22453.1 putative glucose-6-phosphate 1-epimerase [Pseudomonas fluorescens]